MGTSQRDYRRAGADMGSSHGSGGLELLPVALCELLINDIPIISWVKELSPHLGECE